MTSRAFSTSYLRSLYKDLCNGNPSAWWDLCEWADDYDPALRDKTREVAHSLTAADRRLKEYKRSLRYRTKIRPYCNLHYPNDCYPYEVIRVISPQTVEVREMSTSLLNGTELVFHPGGFAAHCSNQHAQRWSYTSNPDNQVIRLRLGKKGWGNGLYHMSDTPRRFYDYNL